jgi:putative sterol carrier protein
LDLAEEAPVPDPVEEFFSELARRKHEPLLAEASGAVRFDLESDHRIDRWVLVVEHGDISVSTDGREADTVVYASKALFARVVAGAESIYAAWVRNAIKVDGNLRLAFLIRRVIRGQPDAHDPREFGRRGRYPG